MNRTLLLKLAVSALVLVPLLVFDRTGRVEAGGARFYTRSGRPFGWDNTQPIKYTPDLGRLGVFDNTQAVQLTAELFNHWASVQTAKLSFAQDGQLAVDVRGANVMNVLNGLPRTTNPIIFDHDGTVTDALRGQGASAQVLGFSGILNTVRSTGRITQAFAVLNGKSIATGDKIPELRATATHEFGHFIGLDHTAVNREEFYDGRRSGNNLIPVMFSFATPEGGDPEAPRLDDMVAVSAIYPSPTLSATTGTIRGRILYPNGIAGFQGTEVIARRVGSPRIFAAGSFSGFRYTGSARGRDFGVTNLDQAGYYEMVALPPGSYTVEVREIPLDFTGGSSAGPLDPQIVLPAPEEFYSGAEETNHDDPLLSVPVTVEAGGVVDNVDIILNGQTPANDDCAGATVITSTPFSVTQNIRLATIAPDDGLHTCSGSRDSNSVWYSFTAPTQGIITANTAGSDYDTILAVYTGTCADRTEVACNDDVSDVDLSSSISFIASAGTTYLIQAASIDDGPVAGSLRSPDVGSLRFSFNFQRAALVTEQEPNNTPEQAQSVPIPAVIEGQAERGDMGSISVRVGEVDDDVEDLYKFTLTSAARLVIDFRVPFSASAGAFLLRIDGSRATVVGSTIGSGTINVSDLSAGTYFIGVAVFDFDTSSPPVVYRVAVASNTPGSIAFVPDSEKMQ